MTNQDTRLILALDFGGTKNSAALATVGGRTWRGLKRQTSPPNPNSAYDWATMLALAHELLPEQKPAAIGVSFGGPASAGRGQAIRSDHVPGWENFPLVEKLEREFGAPAVVDNDANVAALGEARFGAGRNATSLLYLTVSTGVGGGWVFAGKIWRGFDELAGEIGHLQVDPNGPVCVCGKRGCVEILACGPAIAREAREWLQREPAHGPLLREWVQGDLSRLTAQLVNQAALAGDDLAREVMDAAARALGQGIGAAIVLMNPERVVIGGGVSKSGEHYFETVRAAARSHCRYPMQAVNIIPAALGDDAPLWGAVAMAEDLLV